MDHLQTTGHKLIPLDSLLSPSNRPNQRNSRIPCSVVAWKEKLNSSLKISEPVEMDSSQKWLNRVDGGRDGAARLLTLFIYGEWVLSALWFMVRGFETCLEFS